MPPHRVLQAQQRPIRYVYFVTSGLFSEVLMLQEGMADVSLVGREGMLGLSVWLGAHRAMTQWRSHMMSRVLRMPVDAFRAAAAPGAELSGILSRYTVGVVASAAQLAACNGVHTIEQRLAVWLLTATDRARQSALAVSHRTIAQMLCVRRAGVSELLGAWARTRIITVERTSVSVLDRRRLQRLACGCYRAIRRAVSPAR